MATSLIGPLLVIERINRSAATAATASNQGDLDKVTAGGMDMWNGHFSEGRNGGDAAGSLRKFPSRTERRLAFVHKVVLRLLASLYYACS
jgi:hypothetical protein